MTLFGIVLGDVMTDFELGFGQARKVTAVE